MPPYEKLDFFILQEIIGGYMEKVGGRRNLTYL